MWLIHGRLIPSVALALAAPTLLAGPAMAAGPVTMTTGLSGAAEVPGPGAPNGAGTASITVDSARGQVCFSLTATGTDTPTMAHIHKGAVGVAGPVIVALDPPASGSSSGCKPAEPEVITALLATPTDYYVNVHTAAFPKGAMRGQLGQ